MIPVFLKGQEVFRSAWRGNTQRFYLPTPLPPLELLARDAPTMEAVPMDIRDTKFFYFKAPEFGLELRAYVEESELGRAYQWAEAAGERR